MSRSLEPSSASSQRFAGRSSLAASAIVGLGVAADNVASASEFFRHLPPDTGMAFVVVTHQPSPSAAVAALARGTPMTVTDVRQRTRPRPNHVYVTSPDGVLEIEGDDPWLVRRRPVSDPSRIDAFFRSLAQQRRYGAIGVLLAGTGAVGQRGLGAIREQGGLTYAEEALVADFVFRPAAIAREIAWLGRDRSFGAGLRRVGAAHVPGVRHILRLPTDDREVLRAEQHSLATVNEELEHLLDSLDMPMVVVDAESCVRRFTSSARRMVNVIASDIGRPIGDIHWNVSVGDVDEMVRSAAASGTTAQRDVRDQNGRYNVLTVRPYRAPGGRQVGAVITLVDIDAHAAARTALQSELELQDAVTQELVAVSQVPDGALHLVRTICQRTAWPYGELWARTSGADTRLERIAFWNQLASGRPKTLSAVSPPAGGRAIAQRVSDSGQAVWQYGGWVGRPKWRTVFACPLEGRRAAGVLVLCDRERRPRDEHLLARLEWIGQQIGVWIDHKSAEDHLRRREAEYRQLSRGLLHIQDDERRGLARELHDSTTQHLAALLMNLDRIGKFEKPLDSRLRHLVTESRLLAEQCVGEIRTIANRLQPPLLDEMGLVSAVRWFVARFTERSGIRVEVVVRDVGRLIVAVERVLFRVVQESLVNIERHAASPTAVVSLAAANGDLLLEVRDQGRGLRAGGPGADRRLRTAKTGAGILAMRERIDQLGGEFDIQFTDHGTTVQVRVPLQEGNR